MDTPSNYIPPTPKTYTYKTVDNLALEADVFVPTTSIEGKYPVVFAIHGGGYIFGAKEDGYTPKELEEMLSRGWCVVSINYRLAPHAFFQDMIQDIQDAYHWVRTELVKTVALDIDSVILLGQSAGGGLVLTSGFMLSPRPQAIIAFYPAFVDFTESVVFDSSTPVSPTIIEEMKAHMEPSSAYAFKKAFAPNTNDAKVAFFSTVFQAKKFGWMLATHDPDESAESITKVLKEYSASFHVDSKYPPTVFVHGVKDEVIPLSESINMAKRLEEDNVPHLLKLIPEAIHGFNFIPNAMPAGAWEEYILPAFDFAGKYIRSGDSKVESK